MSIVNPVATGPSSQAAGNILKTIKILALYRYKTEIKWP
jgi:hypothetical protein